MSKIIGRQINVGIGKEATRGTAVAPDYTLKLTAIDFDDKLEAVTTEQGVGVIEDATGQEIVKTWGEGNLEGRVYDRSFGLILLSALGSLASVETADTGVYAHTFSVEQGVQHQSLTIDIKSGGNEQSAFANAMINSLEISAPVNEAVKFNASLMSKVSATSTESHAYITENGFLSKDTEVYFADDKAGLGGATAIKIKNLSLSINKNLESDEVLGEATPQDFNNKQFTIEGSIELTYDDATYKNLAIAGTQKAMRIEMIDTATTIGASSNPKIVIDLAKVMFSEYSRSNDLDGIVTQSLNFKAFYSLDDSEMIEAVITNLATDY